MDRDAQNRLSELLDREIEAAHRLSQTLTAERAALIGSDSAAVAPIAEEKIVRVRALEKFEHERRTLSQNMEDAQFGLSRSVAERWQALMRVVSKCRAENDVNGHIIHVRQHQIRQLIDIVRGGTPATYSAQGKTVPKAQRPLARA